MINLLAKIPLFYRPFFLPVLILVSILVLSLTLGKYAWDKIGEQRAEISGLQTKNSKLSLKKGTLTSLDKQVLLAKTQASVDGVPGEVPALPALASLNFLARQAGVAVTDFRVSERKDSKAATSYLEINVNFDGQLTSSLSFLNELKDMAPLVKITEVGANVQGGFARSKVLLNSIWAPLPKDLGEPESLIEPLSKADEEIASKLLLLKKPQSSVTEGSTPQGRTNPFAL